MQCTRQIARRFVQHVDIDYLVFPVVPVLSKSGTGGGVALMWHHRRTIAGRRGGREQGLHRRPEGRTDGRPLNSQPNCLSSIEFIHKGKEGHSTVWPELRENRNNTKFSVPWWFDTELSWLIWVVPLSALIMLGQIWHGKWATGRIPESCSAKYTGCPMVSVSTLISPISVICWWILISF